MHILLLFLDGIGLGEDDPERNPFVCAHLPTLTALTNGLAWTKHIGRQTNARASFVPTDPRLGIAGRPQSGTSQAAILTGINVPALIGEHYGPKPNQATRELLQRDNLFIRLKQAGKSAALLDAYPPDLLARIARGKTLPSSIQYAAISSGQALFSQDDVLAGRALTCEWTNDEWRNYLKIDHLPELTPFQAGERLAQLTRHYDFAMHSHWMTDYIGHRGDMQDGIKILERFDAVMAGLLSVWDFEHDLCIITSDHGNMEQIGLRNHTENDVPTLIIGQRHAEFAQAIQTLADLSPNIAKFLQLE